MGACGDTLHFRLRLGVGVKRLAGRSIYRRHGAPAAAAAYAAAGGRGGLCLFARGGHWLHPRATSRSREAARQSWQMVESYSSSSSSNGSKESPK